MTDPTAPSMRRRPRRRRAVLLGIAITAVLAGGVPLAFLLGTQISDETKGAPPITVTGSVTLGMGAYIAEDRMGAPCEGDGGYSDIRAGAQVTIRNAESKVIAVGQLEQGYSAIGSCTANFTIKDVPGGEDFYGVTIASRNEMQYAKEQLAQRLDLTLG